MHVFLIVAACGVIALIAYSLASDREKHKRRYERRIAGYALRAVCAADPVRTAWRHLSSPRLAPADGMPSSIKTNSSNSQN